MVNDQSNYNWKDPGAGRAASDHTINIKNVSVIQFIWGQVNFLDSNWEFKLSILDFSLR